MHTYQFLDEDTTWEEARKLCIAHGGHLATVTSAEEQMRKDFTMLLGEQTGMDSVKHSGGEGKNKTSLDHANQFTAGSYHGK